MMIPITESQWQRQVTDLATRLGWDWLHVERMGNARGEWRTPAYGPLGKGWPDLVLIRRGTTVYAELKAQNKYPSEAQKIVLAILANASPHVYVWRPSDFPLVLEVLTNA